MQSLFFGRGRTFGVLAGVVALAACTDQSPTGGSAGAPPAVPFGAMAPVDHNINQADTWVSFDATRDQSSTITSQEPVFDARSGQYTNSLTVETPAQPLHAEAGYDTYGTLRYNEYRQVSSADPADTPVDPTTKVEVVGDQVTVYDQSGPTYTHEQTSEPPLAELGSLQGAQITQGMVLDYEPAHGDVHMTSKSPVPGVSTTVKRMGANRVQLVETRRDVLPLQSQAPGSAGPGGGNARHESVLARTYARSGAQWVLEELAVTNRVSDGGSTFENRQRTRLRNVRWHRNRAQDEVRRQRRAEPQPPAPRQNWQPVDNCTDDPCLTDPGPGNPGGSGGSTGTTADPCTDGVTTGRHVVFQHGIFSSGSNWGNNWGGMPARLGTDLYLDCTLQPNLNSDERLAYQAGTLADQIRQRNLGSMLLFGHSQGGLISRYVGQHHPELVNGVVTIGTPHRGAPITRTSRVVVGAVLGVPVALASRGCSSYSGFRCGGVGVMAATIPVLMTYGVDTGWPAFIDLKPGSDFQQQLNSSYEGFPRAGIQSYPSRLWVEWRLYGDTDNTPDAGRATVRKANYLFAGTTVCSAVGWIIGHHSGAMNCAYTAGGMLAVDLLWNAMVAGFGKSDGVVPGSSQIYPNAHRNVDMRDGAPSHTGEMRSEETRKAARVIFRDVMSVTPRRAF